MLINGFTDIALGKCATSSSRSSCSSSGAGGVLTGDVDAPFGFHTELEDKPWWQVDLGVLTPLVAIVVHNRRDGFQDRARSIRVEISVCGNDWVLVHSGLCHFEATPDGEPLRLPLGGRFRARYVRLSLDERAFFHLSRVEVLVDAATAVLAELAELHGLELQLAKDLPDPTFYSGYSLRSVDGSPLGPLIGLSICENGAFGNCMMQYSLAVYVAQRLELPFIKISENDRSQLIRLQSPLSIDGLTFIPADVSLPEGGLFLHGFFFDPAPFLALGSASDQERHAIIRRYVRRLFNVLPPAVPAKAVDQIMLHVRSGDIFDNWVNPHYVQPPLAFYVKVIDLLRTAGKISSAVVVYENKLNPVIEPLEAYLISIGFPFCVSSGSVDADIQALMNAKYYTFGLGTFGPAVCHLSDDIEMVFYFSPGMTLGFEAIPSIRKVIEVVDSGGGYLTAGQWQNTPEQRQLMVSYPAEKLSFANELDVEALRARRVRA